MAGVESPGVAAGSPQEEREDAHEDKKSYEEEDEEVEPYVVNMHDAWKIERVIVIPSCEELGEYKSMEKQAEKLSLMRETSWSAMD
jgi:hypothetical protein